MKLVKNCIKKILIVTGRKYPVFNTKLLFFVYHHRLLDLKHPESFSAKISFLKLFNYNSNPLIKTCADKCKMREYAKNKGFGNYLSNVYGMYSTVDDIPWDDLPDSFVMKWNFWYGLNIICWDKRKLKIEKTASVINKLKNNKDYYATAELQYDNNDKVLICEKFIPDLVNYKFYYFHGECKAVLVNNDIYNNHRLGTVYDPYSWEKMEMVNNCRYDGPLDTKKPDCLLKMLEIGSKLSQDFPFVRVDMYIDDGRPVIGEMTFTPGAGITPSEVKIDDRNMGEFLKI